MPVLSVRQAQTHRAPPSSQETCSPKGHTPRDSLWVTDGPALTAAPWDPRPRTHLPLLGQGLLQVIHARLRPLHFCLELLTGLWGGRRDTSNFL